MDESLSRENEGHDFRGLETQSLVVGDGKLKLKELLVAVFRLAIRESCSFVPSECRERDVEDVANVAVSKNTTPSVPGVPRPRAIEVTSWTVWITEHCTLRSPRGLKTHVASPWASLEEAGTCLKALSSEARTSVAASVVGFGVRKERKGDALFPS